MTNLYLLTSGWSEDPNTHGVFSSSRLAQAAASAELEWTVDEDAARPVWTAALTTECPWFIETFELDTAYHLNPTWVAT